MFVKKSSFFMECLPGQSWITEVRYERRGKDKRGSTHLEYL